ncbi:MAG: SAM-dependent methyltransferase, partial [Acidimicrobiia bacterium]|nr:SAM-dependent methyltransferase [Acidimicrobiia bacterium]
MTEIFAAGDQCLLIDGKKRRFLLRLKEGGAFHSHHGVIEHDVLIGAEDGTRVVSTGGAEFVVLRPRLSDYVLKMRRGAQVVYPKDLGPILVYADIAPGSVVVEAGTGSGALTLGLLRAVGPSGRVVSVERREDHADHAKQTINRWLGGVPENLDLRIGQVEDEIL